MKQLAGNIRTLNKQLVYFLQVVRPEYFMSLGYTLIDSCYYYPQQKLYKIGMYANGNAFQGIAAVFLNIYTCSSRAA